MNGTTDIEQAGRPILAFGHEIRVLLSGDQTAGKLTMFHDIAPPGAGSPPHYHEREDEWFYILSGQAEFYRNGEWTAAPERSAVFVPRNTVHAFRNAGKQMLHLLIAISPAGFDRWLKRCAEEFKDGKEPDMAKISKWAEEIGMHFV